MMGCYRSVIIAVRVGGVFSGSIDREDFRKRIVGISTKMVETDEHFLGDGLDPEYLQEGFPISNEISGPKGSYVVIGGVMNYGDKEDTIEFARKISEEFGTEVFLIRWDELTNDIVFRFFLAGKNHEEISENPVGAVLRRAL